MTAHYLHHSPYMDAEQFCEILTEYGFPLDAIKGFWAARTFDYQEARLRETCQTMVEQGFIEKWKAEHQHAADDD